tara:strand:- start:30763 stop:31650 length:888 start_codon:yes stop_codon:yes gene_type:complete
MTGFVTCQPKSLQAFIVLTVAATFCLLTGASSQTIIFDRGQNIVPAFEGWEQNPDGSFDLIFGYMNRNAKEKVFVPIGPENYVEPGGPDQGQPTFFEPRRNRYMFRVTVPENFGTKEVVWTLTVRGKTEQAYGSLKADYVNDSPMMQKDVGGLRAERDINQAPVVRIEGNEQQTAMVGMPITLTAIATDDDIPPRQPAAARPPVNYNAWGLRLAWITWRGNGNNVSFSPEQFDIHPNYDGNSPWSPGWEPPALPADGRFPVDIIFSAPGTYVMRAFAHDGGLAGSQDVTIVVNAQ